MAEFIEFLSKDALAELQLANKELVSMVSNVEKVGQKMKNISSPSGSSNAIKDLSAEYQRQEKVIQSLQQKLQRASEQAVKNAERQRLEEVKLASAREKAFDKFEKGFAKEQQRLTAAQNLYNKTQRQLNMVQAAYNNLAVKKERYNNLTAFEEARLKTLQTLTEKYNTTLKAVDATVGKHTRNVGNYGSAFDPVSNSITQLTREMPAFANSVQTGFMAISNNLPVFFDAMQQAIAQQKELQAQGQPSKNALQILAGGLFTLGTALSVGVTLLTLYGAEIVNFISGSKKKKEAIEQEKKAIEEKQKAEEQARETTAGFQSSELAKSKILFENAKNLTLSYKERKEAINELRERYPDYLKNLTDEQILAGNTADAENALNEALIKRGVALAAQEMLQKNLTDELKLRLKNSKLLKESLDDQRKLIEQGNQIVVYTDKQKAAEQQKEAVARKSRRDQYNAYVQSILALRDERQAILATYNENAKYLGVVNEVTKSTKEKTKSEKESIILKIGTVKWLEKQIASLEELNNTLSTTSEEYQVGVGAIKFYQQWLERLIGTTKKTSEELDGISLDLGGVEFLTDEEGDRIMEEGNKLRAWLKDFRKDFSNEFWAESGLGEIQFILDNWDNLKESGTDAALAISEAFQQAFNTISQYSNANFQQMYSNLEQQRDVAILFAGESATAREEIDRQYEERRKRIQRQQAEAQKRLALFNIATNTAQAIMATFAQTPPPAGIPLAALIGAIGAAQLALTASQPIPAFEKGGVHDGGLMLVNDGKGSNYRETIVTPDGKVMKPQGKNVVMNAPKGTQIFTHDQWQDKLNNLLLSNGIEQNNSRTEVNPIINVETKDNYHFEVNEKGFKTFVTRGQAKTEILNARFRQQKRYV